MEIVYKNKSIDIFNNRWQEYIDNNLVSYKYTILNIEYFLLYGKYLIDDKSFVIVENNRCVGICFLPIEDINHIKSISIADGYTISPLSIEKRIEKRIFSEINKIVQDINIQKIKFYLDPLILEYTNKFNTLLEYNFMDTSTSDCLVDLRKSKQELWKNLRKSYKSLINSTLKNNDFEIIIIDQNNPNYNIHLLYKKLHNKCAGNTRIKETFEKQYEMLENDLASLIGLKYKNEFIGFNYFFHHQKTVIYASGADDPKYENSKIPIYHIILWSAIQYYKNREFEYCEFSQPCGFNKIDGFNNYLDEKQINISHFKRGMGTKMVPAFRGIKYLNKELLINDINAFTKNISKKIFI